MAMSPAEAIDIIENTCPCNDPLCPDTQYLGQLHEARQVLRDLNADEIAERQQMEAMYDDPPRGWEP